MSTVTTIGILSIGSYLIAAALQGIYLARSERQPHPALVSSVGLLAITGHIFISASGIYMDGQFDLGIVAMLSLVFCSITTVFWLAALKRPVNNLLIVFYPLAALSVTITLVAPSSLTSPAAISPGLFAHIFSSVLAYSFLTIATIQGFALGLQDRQLKQHHISGILQILPPLQTMEKVFFELVWLGLLLLTVSLLSGFIYLDDIFAQQLIHKTFFSLLAWLLFAILLWGRHQWGWRSHTASRWTIGGFIALLLAYFGSKFVLEILIG